MKFPFPQERLLPHEIPLDLRPNSSQISEADRFVGSLVGLAVGDALGASVEFRPHQYFVDRPVRDMQGGGTWGLQAGQWTDDTSMALCLASSLLTKKGYDPYDQMVRYKWWYKYGYLSSTGYCFDIGNATRDSLEEFSRRQKSLLKHFNCKEDELDSLSWNKIQSIKSMDINCSASGVAGNGALMRLAPVPLFFYQHPVITVEYAGRSARLTHGDQKAVDACRYYAALIVAAVNGQSKEKLLNPKFYETNRQWFGSTDLHPDILRVALGSYKKPNGYEGGIRGKGYIVDALEAALWAFWSDEDSFEIGALAAVNLGDDTDTTAAIYGQLAGAFYGYKKIPKTWLAKLYAKKLLVCIGQCLYSEGQQYKLTEEDQKIISSMQTSTKTLLNKQQSSAYQTSTDHVDANPSGMYTKETKYASQSRSENERLPLSQQQSDRRRVHRPSVEQFPTSQLEGTHASGSGFNQSSKNTRDYKGSSPYGSGTEHSSVGNLDVRQVGPGVRTSTRYSTDSSTSQLPETYPIERPLPGHTNRGYSYDANQLQIRSPRNDQLPVNDRNSTRGFEAGSYNIPIRPQYSNNLYPGTAFPIRYPYSSPFHNSPTISNQYYPPVGSSIIHARASSSYNSPTIYNQYNLPYHNANIPYDPYRANDREFQSDSYF